MENNRFRLYVYLAVFLVIIILGTIGFTLTEGWSIEDSVYFCIVTVATVGYGDLHPAINLRLLLLQQRELASPHFIAGHELAEYFFCFS